MENEKINKYHKKCEKLVNHIVLMLQNIPKYSKTDGFKKNIDLLVTYCQMIEKLSKNIL
jgi:hypothetical protein